MNEVNKTLYIPLFGKAQISRKNIILQDKKAEEIWDKEAFPIKGRSRSKWLTYFMAMRARVFDDWTDAELSQNKNALVLHIGCGLDSRCLRVKEKYTQWVDADFPDVLLQRRQYFEETANYHMVEADASKPDDIKKLPDSSAAIVILEGISMYLSNDELKGLFCALREKYGSVHLLMDVYTEFAVKASKYKNPVNEVGVTKLYGVDNIEQLAEGTGMEFKAEHSMTPDRLVNELKGFDKSFFKATHTGKMAGRIYRLYELETRHETPLHRITEKFPKTT